MRSPVFGIGVTVAYFHLSGKLPSAKDKLSRWVNSCESTKRV